MRSDLTGELPSGTTVIEASAGTGKTYAIVGLATRYIAEGLAELPQLMLVTFGRAATQELRERTRTRLVATAAALADPDTARRSDDQLIAHLATGDDTFVDLRRRRLLRALSDFDAATIATTHSFCQRMLDGLAIAGEREPDAVFVESVEDIAEEVICDLYLSGYSNADPSLFPLSDARGAAREAIRDSQARLVPADADPDTLAGRRVAFAERARAEVEHRKRRRGIRDFDDLLVLLRDTLAHPVHGAAACRRIQKRYRVVLVDEFQDTDPVQWDILRLAFHGSVTLVLVGDPKQAIYAFRGAEVLAYLDAVHAADNQAELDMNWRSDAGMLAALQQIYGGSALGHPDIVAHPVAPAPEHAGERLPGAAPLRLRYLTRTGCGPLNQSGFPAVGAVRDRIAADLADDIVSFLNSGCTVQLDDQPRPVMPSDIAVLVRTRSQVALVRAALQRVGVPAVLAGGTSVFATDAVTAWLGLLHGLEQPHRPARVRLAALTPLLGVSATELDAGRDDLVAELSGRLRELAIVFAQAGVAAVFEHLTESTGLDERLLHLDGGERMLTDLRHLAHILNRAAAAQSLGLTALIGWLSDRMAEDQLVTSTDRSRLLDRDSAAVRIVTIHAAKGLEFPVVYVPFSWDGVKPSNLESLLLHEAGQRVRDVGGRSGPGYAARRAVHQREEAGEDLRLLYVALTRAMCRVVAWWAPTAYTRGAPLHRLLMGRTAGQLEPAEKPPIPADAALAAAFANWTRHAGGVIAIEAVPAAPEPPRRWSVPAEPTRDLAVAPFTRHVDLLWRRTSYTALTAAAHPSPGVASETEEVTTIDEPAAPLASPAERVAAGSGTASLMNSLPAGPVFGTLVHSILEHVDTSAADLAADVRLRCQRAQARRLTNVDVEVLAAALTAVLATPLGRGTLADVTPADRLTELDFELPLARALAVDRDLRNVTLARMADVLRRHLPGDDPLASYPDLLATLTPPPLRGFLTGSLDAVLRHAGPEFVIVDYKTNKLVTGPVDAT